MRHISKPLYLIATGDRLIVEEKLAERLIAAQKGVEQE
jgi:hypothetical protein